MASAILSGIAPADKSSSEPFNTTIGVPAKVPPTPADPVHLATILRTAVAGLVEEQIGIALGAFLAAFQGASVQNKAQPMPVARLERNTDDAVTPDLENAAATVRGAGNSDEPMDQPRVSPRLRSIPADQGELQPLIFLGDGCDRSAFGKEPALRRPGIYVGLWPDKAYVGMGKRVGARVATNDRLYGADRICCIAEAYDQMTVRQALVCERLLAQIVQQSAGLELDQSMPSGAPIEPEDYDTGRLLVARACLALRQAGILFTNVPSAALLLPPTSPPERHLIEDGATVYAIATPGLRAHLTEHQDGWLLLQGSEVRSEVRPSAYGPAAMRRAELLHSGALLQTGAVLTSTQDLIFSSAWSAAHFVLGEKPRSNVWKPIGAPITAKRPTR